MIAPSSVYDSATSIAQVYDGTKHSWNTKWQFNKVTKLCIRMKDVASVSFVIHDDIEIVITAYHQYPQFWNPRPNLENILGIGDNSLSRPALKLSVNYHQYRTCADFHCLVPRGKRFSLYLTIFCRSTYIFSCRVAAFSYRTVVEHAVAVRIFTLVISSKTVDEMLIARRW